MALSFRPFYEGAVRQFRTSTADDNFGSDFVQAVNDVLDELSFSASLLTALSHVDAIDDSCDDLDAEHGFIVRPGITVKLVEYGHQHRTEGAYQIALAQWEARKGDFMVMKSREDQADTDDDDTPLADLVGLGYQGEDTGTGVPDE